MSEIVLYAGGTLLGLASQIAEMHKHQKVTVKDVIISSTIALSTAFCLYWMLKEMGVGENLRNGAAVLCGRFADDVLKLLWRTFRKGMGWESKDKD